MNPKIIKSEGILLAGFSFFGNPIAENDPWTEGNEIGKLWGRFMTYVQQNGADLADILGPYSEAFEIHISHPETKIKGEYEVFVGAAVLQLEAVPVEMVVKVLPPTQYAVFTLEGEQINSDWHKMIYQEWMPDSGYTGSYEYGIQAYDERFKGVDNLADSVLDVHIPIKTLNENL